MSKLVGKKPYQTPRNSDLGTLAYQDSAAVTVDKLTIGSNEDYGMSLAITANNSSISMGDYNYGAIIWMDGVDGDFVGGDYGAIMHQTDRLSFHTASLNYALVIEHNGKVGIGIGDSEPETKLEVNHGSSGGLKLNSFYQYARDNYSVKIDGTAGHGYGYISEVPAQGGIMVHSGGTYYGGGLYDVDANATGMSSIKLFDNDLISLSTTTSTGGTQDRLVERVRISADDENCGATMHVAGPVSMASGYNTSYGSTRVQNWYATDRLSNTNGTTYYIKTSLWGGASGTGTPGNSQYIMGGFEVRGYRYTDPGNCFCQVGFHNWVGALYGYTVSHSGSWTPTINASVGADGYVQLELGVDHGYCQYIIDFIQYPLYPQRDVRVIDEGWSSF